MGRAGWQTAILPLDRPDAALTLEREVYGETDVSRRDYFDWLYRAGPGGDAVIGWAPTGTGSAGHYALVPIRMRVRGRELRAGLALNVVTHPAHRREGVFAAVGARALEAAVANGLACAFALPNPQSHPGFLSRLGFIDVGRVPLLLAPLAAGPVEVPWSWPWRVAARGAVHVAARALARARRRDPPPRAIVQEWPANAREWSGTWEALRDRYPVMVVRDAAWMAWRFGACPTRRYRLFVATGPQGVAGFVVTRTATLAGVRAGLVVDLLVAPGAAGTDAGAALLARARREFATARLGLAAALAPSHTVEYGCLRRAGFLPCPRRLEPQPFRVVLRTLDPAVRIPGSIDAWLLTLGDYDVA